jgi:hypothetical protein
MRYAGFVHTFRQALSLYVESWSTQVVIYSTTLLVAFAVALVADFEFGVPIEVVVKLTTFSTLALLVLVPLVIVTWRLKLSARHQTLEMTLGRRANRL